MGMDHLILRLWSVDNGDLKIFQTLKSTVGSGPLKGTGLLKEGSFNFKDPRPLIKNDLKSPKGPLLEQQACSP